MLNESASCWTEWEFTRALSLAVKIDALRINSWTSTDARWD